MLNDIKKILGYSNNQFDTIIQTFISAGKLDLKQVGIVQSKIVETDPLIYSALVSYVLSLFDTYEYREMAAESYALQKDALRHYQEYIRG